MQESFNEFHPALSPDGHRLAYASDETGQAEVYILPYPGPGRLTRISTAGGREPLWAPDGEELFYSDRTDGGVAIMAVSIQTEPALRVGEPRVLFQGDYLSGWPFGRNYDLSPDGRRFLMIEEGEPPSASTEFIVVLDWFEELKQREPSR